MTSISIPLEAFFERPTTFQSLVLRREEASGHIWMVIERVNDRSWMLEPEIFFRMRWFIPDKQTIWTVPEPDCVHPRVCALKFVCMAWLRLSRSRGTTLTFYHLLCFIAVENGANKIFTYETKQTKKNKEIAFEQRPRLQYIIIILLI